MRISPAQSTTIRALVIDMIGNDAIIILFASHINNNDKLRLQFLSRIKKKS